MALEDFTTYTEVDPNSDMTITAPKIAVDTMRRDEVAWAVFDKGAGHFGDFIHLVKFTFTSVIGSYGGLGYWGLSNIVGTIADIVAANVGILAWNYRTGGLAGLWYLQDVNDDYDSSLQGFVTRYATIERNGTSLTLKLYSDAERTELEVTLSVTCVTTTYRYVYGAVSREKYTDPTATTTGDIENLDLQEAVAGGRSQVVII